MDIRGITYTDTRSYRSATGADFNSSSET